MPKMIKCGNRPGGRFYESTTSLNFRHFKFFLKG